MNKYLLLLFLLISVFTSKAQLIYSLNDIILRAREQSPAAKQAETRKENLYWQYRLYKSDYNPQIRLSGNAPGYNRDFFNNRLDDGTIDFQSQETMFSFGNLRLLQPVALTGGELSVNTNLYRYSDLPLDLNTWSNTLFNIRVNQPLLSFNALKWDKKTEPLRYEESKRSYVEEMELISSTAVDLFFDYLDAQVNNDIANFNLSKNDTIYKIETGRYNIGTTSRDKLLQVELQLLRSQQDVAQADLDLKTSALNLRAYLGLGADGESFTFLLPNEIPEIDVDIASALEYAKLNRSDYIAFERRRLEADRQVAQARGQRFDINLVASYGLNNSAATLSDSYNTPNSQQRLNVTFDIPIMDWGRNKARNRTALANKQYLDYVIAQDEQTFEQEIITQVSQFDVLKSQIEISKKSDEVAQERYMVSQNQYLIGKIDITNLNIALTEKDAAKRSYLSALRSFWKAYYELRRLTLYDFVDKDLLYQMN